MRLHIDIQTERMLKKYSAKTGVRVEDIVRDAVKEWWKTWGVSVLEAVEHEGQQRPPLQRIALPKPDAAEQKDVEFTNKVLAFPKARAKEAVCEY